jgi:hypothetical protein
MTRHATLLTVLTALAALAAASTLCDERVTLPIEALVAPIIPEELT